MSILICNLFLPTQSHEKLQIEQARGPRLEGADSKSWKSIVVTRMYEEKLRNTEQEMEKKVT